MEKRLKLCQPCPLWDAVCSVGALIKPFGKSQTHGELGIESHHACELSILTTTRGRVPF